MTQWHIRLKSAALEQSYYIQDAHKGRALESAQAEFADAHRVMGVAAISCEVVLMERVEI